jgi:hypothetical protein
MVQQSDNAFGASPSQGDERDEKENLADAFSSSKVVSEEDQTRGTLHYGSAEDGLLSERDQSGEVPKETETNSNENPKTTSVDTIDNAVSQQDLSSRNNITAASPEPEQQGDTAPNDPGQLGDGADTSNVGGQGMAKAPAPGPIPIGNTTSPKSASDTQERLEASPTDALEVAPNRAPESINLSTNTIAENASGAVVGTLTVIDPDASDSHSFAVSDDRFEVVDGALQLKDGISLDHETAAELNVEVTVTDSAGATLSQSFAITVSDVNEGPAALQMSGGTIAENASGAVVGTLTVIDPDASDSHSFAVSDDRFEVVDGALQLKDGISLDHETAAELNVEVTVTDSAGATLSQNFAITVLEVPDIIVTSGFKAEYFDVNHSLSALDDIDWTSAPTHQEVTSDIDYTNGSGSFWDGGSTDTFGAKITGTVEVEDSGSFQFFLGGDDGAVLFVDGKPVIDNDGLHGFRTRSGEIELEPGTHHIEVRYFENYGHAGLKLEWEGPGLEGREVVVPPDQAALQTVGGVPVNVNLEVNQTNLSGDDSLTLDGLPVGTVVSAGEQSVTVDESGTADITQWDTQTLTITPPAGFVGAVDGEIVVTVHDTNGTSAKATQPLDFQVNEAHISGPEASMVGGFRASYFDVDHTLREIDDIDWNSDPTHQEFVQDINYENSSDSFWEGGSRDTFGARLEGQITVEEGGSYTFFAGADDGVVLYMNGEPLIDNDGLHGFRTRTGEIELEPGTYDIEVRYFENAGHAGLKLEWDGPDTNGRELVTSDLDNHVDENGTFGVGLELSNVSSEATIMLEGLPANTILHLGETSIVTGSDPVDVTGIDTNVLEISPPPGFEGSIEGQIVVTDIAFNGGDVTSHTPFFLTVGDAGTAPASQEYDQSLMSGSGSETQAWNADPDLSEADYSDDDVLSEPMPQSDESASASTDTYERIDW